MSDGSAEYEGVFRDANAWHVDALPEFWYNTVKEFVSGKHAGIPQFEHPVRVSVTIETEEFDENRIRECEAVGGTVSEHRCEECETCLVRKRTVEGGVLFYECPGCGWVTTEVLR
ncbi:hypothetical protein ACFQDG_01230 [Natronoarchaeum mannanilyticum]|uniref:Uncharacterized protein n=1 Tax=Natronoarchaeum mannanilyticum TaxID=926360 RepID=A0AAV3TC15_9EURY